MLAICTDSIEENRDLAREEGLTFPLLSDPDSAVIGPLGLSHEGGGMGGRDIAIPAQLLLSGQGQGRVVWKHVSHDITDRAYPADTRAAIEAL